MLSLVLILCAVVALIQTDTVIAQNPVTVSMSDFTSGADGLRVIGTTNSFAGYALSHVGDFNGDGTNDFLISAQFMSVNSITNAGLIVLVLGHSGNWSEIDLSTVASGATVMKIRGGVAIAQVGTSVGGAGDVNGDGRDDLLIAASYLAYGGLSGCGAVFVLFGSPGPYSDVILSNSFVAGSVGYAIFGSQSAMYLGELANNEVGLLADVNGDGVNDFVVSSARANFPSKNQAGCVWIIYGSASTPTTNIALSSLQSGEGVLFAVGATNSATGTSIDMVGDFNNDGFPDFLIGAPRFSPVVSGTTRSNGGAAYLLFGSSTFTSRDPDLVNFVTDTTGVRFLGAVNNEQLGLAVSGAGDLNGDGCADILMGTSSSSGNKFYVIFGTETPYTADVDMLTFTAGAAGYTVLGSSTVKNLGNSLSRAGDVNQDGLGDLLCSSYSTSASAGQVFVLFGSSITPDANVNVAGLAAAYSFTGTAASQLGFIVSGGFDVNGDGIPDIVMGAPQATVTPAAGGSQRGSAGAAYVVMGPFVLPTDQPTSAPSAQPSSGPSAHPSVQPSSEPSAQPSAGPTTSPSVQPSSRPSAQPSSVPSVVPSALPTSQPSAMPTARPSNQPSAQPTRQPSSEPTAQPTTRPSAQPTGQPSSEPTSQPSSRPSVQPSAQPSSVPTHSAAPTAVPTRAPFAEAGTDSDGSSPALSDGGIAGVVVGGVVFLLVLIAAIALGLGCCAQQSVGAPAPAAEYEMTQVQEA